MKILGYNSENIFLTLKFWEERLSHPIKKVTEFPGKDPAIVAIHGIFGGWPSYGVERYLIQSGRHSFLLDWGNQTGHFEYYVKRLGNFIAKRKIKSPFLLGTSVGGLVAVDYASRVNWNVSKVITVATPFAGLSVPSIGDIFPDVKELRPESEIIKQINELIIPEGKLVCIRGKEDESLNNNGKPPEGVQDIVLPYEGHAKTQMATPEMVAALNRYLK